MARYLLDTNVLLRISNPSDAQHHLATSAVARLLEAGEDCFLTGQVLIELWVVATRPVDVNGLGWSIEQTGKIVDDLLSRFPLAKEPAEIVKTWLDLVIRIPWTHCCAFSSPSSTGKKRWN